MKATGLQGVSKLVQICREARTLANDGILRVLCLHDHGLLPGNTESEIRSGGSRKKILGAPWVSLVVQQSVRMDERELITSGSHV